MTGRRLHQLSEQLTRIFHHQATANAKRPESSTVFVKTAWLHSATMRPRGFNKNSRIFRPFRILATPDAEISGLTAVVAEKNSGTGSSRGIAPGEAGKITWPGVPDTGNEFTKSVEKAVGNSGKAQITV